MTRLLARQFTIPAVAYEATASGLSADGRVLALIEPRVSFPRRETTLVVLGTRAFPPQRLVRPRGDFSFDPISLTVRGRSIVIRDGTEPEVTVDRASFAVAKPGSTTSAGEPTPI